MTRLLHLAGWRYHRRHLAQGWLMLIGVALGVAVVVAVDVASSAVERSLRWSMDALTGSATHEIVGGPGGIDEHQYVRLRLAGWRELAPRIQGKARLPAQGDASVTVLGLDLLAEGARGGDRLAAGVRGAALRRMLSEPATVAVSKRYATRAGLRVGDTLTLAAGGKLHRVEIVALFDPPSPTAAYGLEQVLVADIAVAQELLDMTGRLSRIEAILPAGESGAQAAARLRAQLAPELTLLAADDRRDNLLRLSEAFQLNLKAFSLLALAVGMLLIYNAFTFSVVQRRPMLARLRALGATRGELARAILGEAALVGLIGAALGGLAQHALGQGVLRQMGATVNDLYFNTAVTEIPLPPTAWIKGALLGVASALAAAAWPVWEAVSVPVQAALGRAALEARIRRAVWRLAGAGGALFFVGAAAAWLLPRSLAAAFVALFVMMVSAALLLPLATVGLMPLLRPLAKAVGGLRGAMADRAVVAALSRGGVAVAALAVAVAATVGVTVMIDSFRQSVDDWLGQTLRADVYISAPGGELPPDRSAAWAALLEVQAMSRSRRMTLEQAGGPVELFAFAPAPESLAGFRFKQGDARTVWPAFLTGRAVLISESYAYRHRLGVGDGVRLRTARGDHVFPVVGVYYDYGSEQGTVTLSRAAYDAWWDDGAVTGVGLYLAPGVDASVMAERLRQGAGAAPLLIRSNRDIRAAAMQVFERTFAVTAVLRLLVIVVAVIAVVGALAALILERAREWAVLRALGMLPRQLAGLVLTETLLMGLAAGLFALPLGLGVAYVLTAVIQPRAFGWTMGYSVAPALLVQALLLTLTAAALASIYPAWQVARSVPAAGLRAE